MNSLLATCSLVPNLIHDPSRRIQAKRGRRNIVLSAIIAITVHVWLLSLWTPKTGSMLRDVEKSISLSIIYPVSAKDFPEPQISEPVRKPLRQPTAKPTIDKAIIQKENARNDSDPEPIVKKARDDVDKSGEITKADLPRPVAVSPMTLPDVPEGYSTAEPRKAVITYARPEYKKNPTPLYPMLARKRGYEGRSRLRVEVLANGQVGRIEIAASSGFDILDEAALEAVKDWRFIPGSRNGNRIRQWVVVPVRFRLK